MLIQTAAQLRRADEEFRNHATNLLELLSGQCVCSMPRGGHCTNIDVGRGSSELRKLIKRAGFLELQQLENQAAPNVSGAASDEFSVAPIASYESTPVAHRQLELGL